MQDSNAKNAKNIIQMTDWGSSGPGTKRTQDAIEKELQEIGYQIVRPQIYKHIFKKERSKKAISEAEEALSGDAFASFFFSAVNIGMAFDQLEPRLLPNPIVLTMGPHLQLLSGSYQACVVIHVEWWGEKIPELANHVVKAVRYLESQEESSYPVIGANFRQTDFGWVRNPILDDLCAEKVWDRFRENARRDFAFFLHSAEGGPQDVLFSINDVPEGCIEVQILDHEPGEIQLDELSASRSIRYTVSPPNMLTDPVEIHTIPKADFLTISLLWKDFSMGRISREKLFDATAHSAFLIGIYNWLASENLLERPA